MKKNIFYGFMVAVALLMSSVSFASPYTSEPSYISPDEAFILAVWPPAVPAVIKPGGFDAVAMATGGSYDNDKVPCMASCLIDKRRHILANFYQTNVDLDRTVIACGFESTPIEVPTRIPMALV